MTERVAIIDYGSGNLRSVEKALQRAVADEGLDCRVGVTSLPEEVLKATRIVLPGVGAFAGRAADRWARRRTRGERAAQWQAFSWYLRWHATACR
jgi:imidazoleglycerol phosphate synthase glutamine amidotransferase subunit HisH